VSHEKFISFSGIAIVMNTGGRIPTPKKYLDSKIKYKLTK